MDFMSQRESGESRVVLFNGVPSKMIVHKSFNFWIRHHPTQITVLNFKILIVRIKKKVVEVTLQQDVSRNMDCFSRNVTGHATVRFDINGNDQCYHCI